MGLTKTELFTEKQNEIASLAKVLGHPARIAILEHISKLNACVCGDLVEEIGLAQATISQHLKELQKAGLIHGTIEGTSVCYCIQTEKWERLKNLFNNFFDQHIDSKDMCC